MMQLGKHVCYHFEMFTQAVVNYPTHDKELYSLVQSVKKWKHYMVEKGNNNTYQSSTIIVYLVTN